MSCKSNECSCCSKASKILAGTIAGVILGIIGGILFANSIITATFVTALTALITAIIFLFTVIILSAVTGCSSKAKTCIKCGAGGIFFGIFGTILSAVFALSVPLVAESVFSAVIVGFLFFFFTFMLVQMLFLTLCTSKCE